MRIEKIEVVKVSNGWFVQLQYKKNADGTQPEAQNSVFSTEEALKQYFNSIVWTE